MSRSKKKTSKNVTAAQAERLAKDAAKKRRIELELTEEQLEAFSRQWKKLKPTEAAEIVFTVSKKAQSKLKVAGYSYHGDTCCA